MSLQRYCGPAWPLAQIERDMERDRFMSAEEAKEYGLIDTIFVPRKGAVPEVKGPALSETKAS